MAAVDEPKAGNTTGRERKERTENADRRRRQLLDATLRSVVKNGLAGTTLATVSQETGLSQGVAVFYFKNKQSLLAEALRSHYSVYRDNWRAALAAAGDDPLHGLIALVRSDFDAVVCNEHSLAVWHSFWGEARARPLYAEISASFDAERAQQLKRVVGALATGHQIDAQMTDRIVSMIESFTDGLWLRIYLNPQSMDSASARVLTGHFLAGILPAKGDIILAAMRGESDEGE